MFGIISQENLRCYHLVKGLIKYNKILLIDEKGDESNELPHIFVEFEADNGPISGYFRELEIGEFDKKLFGVTDFTRIAKFPKSFLPRKIGKVVDESKISMTPQRLAFLNNYRTQFFYLYDCDGLYKILELSDILKIKDTPSEKNQPIYGEPISYYQITNIQQLKVGDFKKQYGYIGDVEKQIERKLLLRDKIKIYELRRTFMDDAEKKKNK